MKIYFTRHGQTEWNVLGKLQGWKNSNLTEKGIADAKSLAERLRDVDFDIIYSSSLKRALETAKILRAGRDLEIKALDDLREIGYGSWAGMEYEKVKELYPEDFDNYINRPHLYKPAEGESYEDLYKRVNRALNKILEDKADNILIVSHGITIRVLIAIIKGIPLEKIHTIPILLGTALNICEYDGNKLKLVVDEDTSHLE